MEVKKLEDGLPPLLTRAQVMALLGCKGTSVYRLAVRGALRKVRPAGMRSVRFNRDEVLAWIEAGCPAPEKRRR
jgi:excisionase family DNA binding protein